MGLKITYQSALKQHKLLRLNNKLRNESSHVPLKEYTPPYIQDLETALVPSVGEWIKELWCIYTTEYYSAMKRKEILLFAISWMDLEIIMLSEIRQS